VRERAFLRLAVAVAHARLVVFEALADAVDPDCLELERVAVVDLEL